MIYKEYKEVLNEHIHKAELVKTQYSSYSSPKVTAIIPCENIDRFSPTPPTRFSQWAINGIQAKPLIHKRPLQHFKEGRCDGNEMLPHCDYSHIQHLQCVETGVAIRTIFPKQPLHTSTNKYNGHFIEKWSVLFLHYQSKALTHEQIVFIGLVFFSTLTSTVFDVVGLGVSLHIISYHDNRVWFAHLCSLLSQWQKQSKSSHLPTGFISLPHKFPDNLRCRIRKALYLIT